MLIILRTVILCTLIVSCSGNKNGSQSPEATYLKPEGTIGVAETVYDKTSLELMLDSLGLVSILDVDSTIQVKLMYATKENFTGDILYDNLNLAYLHPVAMEKLSAAQRLLRQNNPELSLLVYDAARPLSVQEEMYNAVRGTKYQSYVANPSRTGLHNYGMAVDLTICDSGGNPLDMGTEFDHFGKLSGINQEDLFVTQGLLTKQQVNNRRLLREVMQQAGFIPIRGEWWHFNACSLSEAKRKVALIQ